MKLGLIITCLLLFTSSIYAATITITVVGQSFNNPSVTINAGDCVQWNGLNNFHTVTQVADASSKTPTGFAARGVQSFNFCFPNPGVYYYICEPHVDANMRGQVTVTPAQPPLDPSTSVPPPFPPISSISISAPPVGPSTPQPELSTVPLQSGGKLPGPTSFGPKLFSSKAATLVFVFFAVLFI